MEEILKFIFAIQMSFVIFMMKKKGENNNFSFHCLSVFLFVLPH